MSMSETLILAVSTTWFEVALVIFMTAFVGIVLLVTCSRSSYFRDAARIPLDDEAVATSRVPNDLTSAPGSATGKQGGIES